MNLHLEVYLYIISAIAGRVIVTREAQNEEAPVEQLTGAIRQIRGNPLCKKQKDNPELNSFDLSPERSRRINV